MEFITILVYFLLISSGSIFATSYFKTKYEEVLPITCTSIVLVSFLFGIIGILKYSIYVILVLALILYVLAIAKIAKEKNIKEIINSTITPGFVLFLVLFLVFLIAIYGKLFDAWDEFSHWGDIVKVMTTLDDFGTNHNSLSMFKSYPPGMSLFQYILEKLNYLFTKEVFVEWFAYFSYYVFAVSFLMPLTKELSFKKPLLMLGYVGAIVCVPFIFYNGVYYQLYIDPFLSFLLAGGLLHILFNEENNCLYDLSILSILFTLVLSKDAGIVFAITLLIAYIIKSFIIGNNIKKNVITTIGGILSILIPKVLWSHNIKINNVKLSFNGKIDFENLISVIVGNDSSYRSDVLDNYISAFKSTGITLKNFNFEISYIVLFMVICIALAFVVKNTKTSKTNKVISYICSIISCVIFVVGMCIIYMYKFSEYEAVGLASFNRYLNIVFMGLFLFMMIALFISLENIKNETLICTILICFMCICSPVRTMLEWIYGTKVRASHNIRSEFTEIVNKTMDCTNGDDEVWFIAQETTGFERLVFKFCIRPNINNAYWSIGTAFFDGDIWTEEKTAEQWQRELVDNYDYVALYKLNDYFYDEFSCVFENPNDINENCVYKVNKTSGLLELCE